MIFKVAWRNIWRNKVRSIVVIMAVGIGLWAGVFASAFVNGMMQQKVDSVIRLEMGHFQVHHPEFRDELLPEYTITNGDELAQAFAADEAVSGYSPRVIAMLMMGSARHKGTIKVSGIVPEQEADVTEIHRYVTEGEYLTDVPHSILISEKTAEKYRIKVRAKVVLTLQDVTGEIVAGAFRVTGLYNSGNGMYDKMNAFVQKKDLQALLNTTDLHEIAIQLNDTEQSDVMVENYSRAYPTLEVLSWKDLSPGMRFMVEAMDSYTMIIVGIILLALMFSIVNTMLMAVLERYHELGMLMAIGMTRPKLFIMVMLETIFLSLIGGPAGLLLSWGTIGYFGNFGLNLGEGAAYEDMGFSNIIFPELDMIAYMQVAVLVIVMSVLAAIYPALKALKLNPIEAIRKI